MSLATFETGNEVFDPRELLARCLGNVAFAQRVLAMCQDRVGKDLMELERNLDDPDAGAIAQLAHRIKGASGNVAASQVRARAAEIEQLGRAQRVAEIPSRVRCLRDAWSRFVAEASLVDWGP